MPENQVRKSVKLMPKEWEYLDRLAEELSAHVTRGPFTGETSWRAMLREIAQGKLEVRRGKVK